MKFRSYIWYTHMSSPVCIKNNICMYIYIYIYIYICIPPVIRICEVKRRQRRHSIDASRTA